MNNKKISLFKIVFSMMLVLACVQESFATCMGTVKFKAPKDWTQAVFGARYVMTYQTVETRDQDGYFTFDLSALDGDSYTKTFSIGNQTTVPNIIVTDTVWQYTNSMDSYALTNQATLPCGSSASDVIYVAEDVLSPGKTYVGSVPLNAKFFYVLIPDEKEWQSDALMIHYTTAAGIVKDTVMTPSSDYCGWFYAVFEEAPSDAVLYRKNAPDAQIGVNGLWGDSDDATPIDLKMLFSSIKGNELFFIPDNSAWPDQNHEGWYETPYDVDGSIIEGTCTFALAAVIYDSDQSLNPVFTSDPDHSGFGVCVGVHTGIVLPDLGPDNKPVFSGSANAVKCFGNEATFNTLFNYAPGINEMQCYDMPFRHYGKDTRWGFDSDSTHYDKAGNAVPAGTVGSFTGGFYPLENTTDASVVVLNGVAQGPTPAARTKRKAEAPVGFTVPDLDHYCNTPGWFGGVDCEGMFQDGDTPAVWDWGVRETWTGVTRNQQYCFESHATFTYSEDQEFTFRGDDDIWVFINKKIAVDNGGAHLATPGHVVLKNLNKTYGEGFLVPGRDYPLDIFFCDRRTTMTNVIIKTNMYIKQSTGLDITAPSAANGYKAGICVETSSGNDCASVALGTGGQSSTTTIKCGDDIDVSISYEIHRRTPDENGETLVTVLTNGASGKTNHGIDLSNPKQPVIDVNKITGLPSGYYRLYIIVNGKKEYLNFRIRSGSGIVDDAVGVLSQNATFVNVDNEKSLADLDGKTWKFNNKGVVSQKVPVYISAVDGDGYLDLVSARGIAYTASVSGGMLYKSNDPDAEPVSEPYTKVVGKTGIDTLWVSASLSALKTDPSPVTVTVNGTTAKINFYAPKLAFAKPAEEDSDGKVTAWEYVTEDPDTDYSGEDYFHWVSSDVDLNVIAINPVTNNLCTECSFELAMFEASPKISVTSYSFENGVAMVRIRSLQEYEVGDEAYIVIGAAENRGISAKYGNLRFLQPPKPMPILVDIFDVYGKPLKDINIDEPYYDEDQDYLDGRADSIAIYYNRGIHQDSVPTYICLKFDEENLHKINPYEMEISNNSKDNVMHCSAEFNGDAIRAAYSRAQDKADSDEGVKILEFKAEKAFSVGVKTHVNAENKLYSFTQYKWKGKDVKTYFEVGLTDRIAPVILAASIAPQSNSKDNVYDIMTMKFSEPVKFDENYGTEAFSMYLNSATGAKSSEDRYTNPTAEAAPSQEKDKISFIFKNDKSSNPTPQEGDFVRFRAGVWSDIASTNAGEAERPSSDAKRNWNSPTDYDESKRLPSPWIVINAGTAYDIDDDDDDSGDGKGEDGNGDDGEDGDGNSRYAAPSFHVKMTGPFTFSIVLNGKVLAKRSYSVMDQQGRVLMEGYLNPTETTVKMSTPGTYVVRVGKGYQTVTVK